MCVASRPKRATLYAPIGPAARKPASGEGAGGLWPPRRTTASSDACTPAALPSEVYLQRQASATFTGRPSDPGKTSPGGGMVVLSLGLDEPAPQCNLSAERHSRGAGPSGRPPTTSAACALATGLHATYALAPRLRLSGARPVPSAGPRAAPARGPPNCQCAHCASGLTPGPQEDCAVPVEVGAVS